MEIATHPRTPRCDRLEETHILSLYPCCPISGNPRVGSKVSINYEPSGKVLEVESLLAYIGTYRGGRDDVRSMEGMVEQICRDCANAVGVNVRVRADLLIEPHQEMILEAVAYPKIGEPEKHENNSTVRTPLAPES